MEGGAKESGIPPEDVALAYLELAKALKETDYDDPPVAERS
jgi:hypothetical protein